MKHIKKIIMAALCGIMVSGSAFAQQPANAAERAAVPQNQNAEQDGGCLPSLPTFFKLIRPRTMLVVLSRMI